MSLAARPVRRRASIHRAQARTGVLLVLPFVLLFAGLFIVPICYAAYLSTFIDRLVGGATFAGLANYTRVVTDPHFWAGFGRVALFLVVQVPIMLCVALFFALAIDSGRLRGGRVARLIVFLPYAIPGVVATLMWGYLYGPNYGLLSQITQALNLGSLNLLSSGNILGAIMNIVCWEFIGYNMIILYSALRAVPAELFDAAEMDGAGPIRVAVSIKIPAIRQAILLTVIFSIIGSFQLFSEPSILGVLAPNAIGNDFSPNLYAYNVAFVNQDLGYSAAIAFVLGLIIMVISYVVQTLTNRKAGGE
ncbi:sugar ABC transporter permease [Amnibacterium sp. CER49]|uniref:carbohydrate ABC transporter permease n=1 Tax=Amnibacterium sp. CER49 TaxID=3039161 RepID=UPI00244BBD4B|nr:sugar ABC transporter permease [Amnibacterium sp. CER49]MDH2442592.1 sugar ABC transporter permease [Amnibacterium sp. CER49]